jgi:two-component system LytT family sensor kinase
VKRFFAALLHAGYWLMYLLLILVFLQWTRHGHQGRLLFLVFRSPIFWALVFPAILSFYGFYTAVFSRFLRRKKLPGLLVSAAGVAVTTALLSVAMLYFTRPGGKVFEPGELVAMLLALSFVTLVHGIIALVMKGFISWYGDIRWKERLIKKNDEMELALVRSQLNPHFLFNTLNNIDVLIGKDPDLASAYLNRLSDLLRFMLYESRTEQIPLEKELLYIGKYIDLQKIRTANTEYIQFQVEGRPDGWMIAPMLFIPFIENAFKHADNKKTGSIRVSLHIEADALHFVCVNSHQLLHQERPDHSGLGNDLIQKRLKLLYPGRHLLEITDKNNIYQAKLVLNGQTH